MPRPTVLIAPATAIPALRQQTNLHESQAFADTDADLALAEIRRQPPTLLAIDRMFALSLLGQAFLNHVKSDERLGGCEIQMVGIRQSPRHQVNVPIYVDGAPGMLIDISMTGAQVASRSRLLPAHRLYVSLPTAGAPLTAFVVRLPVEVSKHAPWYRAGIEFAASAAANVTDYVSALPR